MVSRGQARTIRQSPDTVNRTPRARLQSRTSGSSSLARSLTCRGVRAGRTAPVTAISLTCHQLSPCPASVILVDPGAPKPFVDVRRLYRPCCRSRELSGHQFQLGRGRVTPPAIVPSSP
jgi:hypothetical protein